MNLLNFWIPKDPKSKFKYIFHMVSFYLVQPAEEYNFLTLLRKKCGLDKWMLMPSETKNAARVVNLLELNTTDQPF